MSFIEKFNYNRDSITDSSIVGFTGSPIYGSSIMFSASNSSWRGSNYYQFIMPNGLNSIKAEMSLNFQGNKENIKSILRRIENSTTGTLTGNIAFSGTEDCINFGESKNNVQINLDTEYYKNFSGSQISNYNLKHISSDVYELNLSMFNNRVSPVLNNGMGFVADNTVDIASSSFEAFDVATGSTGSANSEVFNNYFYLTGSRGSSISASNVSGLATYTGFADDSTRTFFFEPDQQVSVPINHSSRINQLKGSFHQQLNISRNQNRIEELQLKFTNRSEKETYAILHFLESHLGYKQFVYYYDDSIINQNKVFYCPQWKHTFNYKDSNTIEARFVEIVAPVSPFGDGATTPIVIPFKIKGDTSSAVDVTLNGVTERFTDATQFVAHSEGFTDTSSVTITFDCVDDDGRFDADDCEIVGGSTNFIPLDESNLGNIDVTWNGSSSEVTIDLDVFID
jgi:phage-related protein